jgi:hypothetical protein
VFAGKKPQTIGEQQGWKRPSCLTQNKKKDKDSFPLMDDWNGKFYMDGGGGMVGGIQSQGWEDALARGYATAGADTGHSQAATRAQPGLRTTTRLTFISDTGVST